MDERRKGEIALILLKYWLGRESIRLIPDAYQKVPELAKATRVSLEELNEFFRLLIEEILKEALGKVKI